MEPTRVIVVTPDFTLSLPQADGSCCVCRSEGLAVPCSSFRLPNSGARVASKLSEFLDVPESAFSLSSCCRSCLTFLMSLDGIQAELTKRLSEFQDKYSLRQDLVMKTEPVDSYELEEEHSKVKKVSEVAFPSDASLYPTSFLKIEQLDPSDPLETPVENPDDSDSDYFPEPQPKVESVLSLGDEETKKSAKKRKYSKRKSKAEKEAERANKLARRDVEPFEGKSIQLTDIRRYHDKKKTIIGLSQWYRLDSCRLCQKEFQEPRLLVNHHREAHPDQPFFLCHFCLRGFNLPNEFAIHVMTEELALCSEGGFGKCKICDEDFGNPRRLDSHFKECHEGAEEACFVCDTCGESFNSYEAFICHRQTKHDPNPGPWLPEASVCPKCKMECAEMKGGIEHHFQMIEFNPKRNCDECGQRFKHTQALEKHVNDVHLKIQPYVCNICGRGFSNRVIMFHHVKRHTVKDRTPKMCTICGKTYRSSLRDHIDAVHLKLEKNKCRHCPEKFSNPPALKRHLASAHQIGVHRYHRPCNVCGKVFAGLINLKYHQFMVHSIRDPKLTIRACSVCGKEFVQKIKLHKHMRSHERREGIKPCYKCPVAECTHTELDPISFKHHMRVVHNKFADEWNIEDLKSSWTGAGADNFNDGGGDYDDDDGGVDGNDDD